jgi:hypothetical protein
MVTLDEQGRLRVNTSRPVPEQARLKGQGS